VLEVVSKACDRFQANQSYLTLALKNILINAAKHSAPNTKVELEVVHEPHMMVFTITDFGEGIPEESVPYIFDPFYRADTARNRAAGGTGIGLSLAMALVKLHHGTITVKSKTGEGAVFIVRIPEPQYQTQLSNPAAALPNTEKPEISSSSTNKTKQQAITAAKSPLGAGIFS
jgi:signal transduction histidine kinase